MFLVMKSLTVESSWNVMVHSDAREGKWRGNWRMEWVASTLHTTLEHGVSSITTADAHTSPASSRLNWRPLSYLNGLVRLAGKRNLVSARVPSHFKRTLISLFRRFGETCRVCFSITEFGFKWIMKWMGGSWVDKHGLRITLGCVKQQHVYVLCSTLRPVIELGAVGVGKWSWVSAGSVGKWQVSCCKVQSDQRLKQRSKQSSNLSTGPMPKRQARHTEPTPPPPRIFRASTWTKLPPW